MKSFYEESKRTEIIIGLTIGAVIGLTGVASIYFFGLLLKGMTCS
jgi:hypothetical protein